MWSGNVTVGDPARIQRHEEWNTGGVSISTIFFVLVLGIASRTELKLKRKMAGRFFTHQKRFFLLVGFDDLPGGRRTAQPVRTDRLCRRLFCQLYYGPYHRKIGLFSGYESTVFID